MKLQINKSDLVEGLNIVSKAVSSKTTLPILTCVLLEAQGNEIRLTGNDMELAIETKLSGTVLEEGQIAIEAKLFSEIVRKLPDNNILISEINEVVSIKCEKANFTISGRRGDDFVRLPSVESDDYVCISQFTLKEMVRQTIFAISANDNNKLMTGEYVEIKDNSMRIVALDGHRISLRKVELKDSYSEHKVIIPGKTLQEISRILPGEQDEDVYIFFSRSHVLFEFGNTVVVSRLIEGEYFKVDKMISKDYETKITVNRKELLDSIERSLLLVRETDKKPIVFKIDGDNLNLSMTSVIGSMKEDMTVEKEGQNIIIGFNPRFLGDALRAVDDEEVSLYMMNPKAPCFIRDENDSYVYLILPINFIQ